VPPKNWHFTLRFLGDTDARSRDALISSLHATRLGNRFSIRFDGLGAFPRVKACTHHLDWRNRWRTTADLTRRVGRVHRSGFRFCPGKKTIQAAPDVEQSRASARRQRYSQLAAAAGSHDARQRSGSRPQLAWCRAGQVRNPRKVLITG
jgi:hypothetical protein